MDLLLDDTIAAPASPPGPAARGVIRISGERTVDVLRSCFRADDQAAWDRARLPRRHSGRFGIEAIRSPLPVTVHLWPTQRSYTGQPLAEVHAVGASPLLEAMLAELYRHGARPARPGEFTLRAFLAGRMDLMQAEAVLGVIDACEQEQLQRALQQLAGGISGLIAEVHSNLLDLLADLEAGLDFVDEDIEFVSAEEVARRLTAARSTVEQLRRQATDRMTSHGAVRIVIAGLPNAGKSTLFNALAGEEAALVSEQVGTTRDYLRAELEWDGLSVELIDTAGREQRGDVPTSSADSRLAALSQQLREDQIQRADLVVWCTPADLDPGSIPLDARLCAELPSTRRPVLPLVTKCDLGPADARIGTSGFGPSSPTAQALPVSAATGEGLDALRAQIADALSARDAGAGGLLGTTAARCRNSLDAAAAALDRAFEAQETGAGDDLLAAEVRDALHHLGEIAGAVYTEDLLERIFSRFCIGK